MKRGLVVLIPGFFAAGTMDGGHGGTEYGHLRLHP
jgi:hypothetical protein